ncbi:MAG: hypothetical protein AAB316_21790, partial [Bacteroidota bacterium]
MVKVYGFAPHENTGCPPLLAPRQPYGSDMFMQTVKQAPQFLCGQNFFAMLDSDRVTSSHPVTCATKKVAAASLLLLAFLLFFTTKSSAQCALVCKGNVTVTLGANGMATITPPQILQSSSGCSNNFIVDVTDSLGNHFGNTVNASHLFEPLMATITHPYSGNNCVAFLTVIDNLPPVLNCEDTTIIWCNEPIHPDSLGRPEVSDNASDSAHISLIFKDTLIDLACFDSLMLPDSSYLEVTALLLRTWTATDESGNVSTCLQQIWMKRATVNDVVFPKHRDGVQLPALECSVQNPSNLALTGQPKIGDAILDNATHCDLTVSFTDQQVPICGGARKIIRTWSVFDLCTNDFRVYAQIIRI